MSEKKLLNDEELEKAAGGMSDDEAQNVAIGARLYVISGHFKYQYGTVVGYAKDTFSGFVRGFKIKLDNGGIETIFNDEVYPV